MPRKERKKESKESKDSSSSAAAAPIESQKERGNRYFAAGNYVKAADCFTESLNLDEGRSSTPDSTHTIYSNRSATYIQLKLYPNALADAEECIKLQPAWSKGYLRKGEALEQLLRYSEALQSYQDGLNIDKEDKKLLKCKSDMELLINELKLNEISINNEINKNNSLNPGELDRFQLLIRWLQDGGAKFPKLYLQYYSEDHRGVHALANVPESDTILYIPHDYIMTSEVAKAGGIAKQMVDCKIDLRSKHSYLAAYLLEEKAKEEKSFWYPYLQCLPQSYSNMPMFFDAEKLALLKGSFTLGKIQDRIDSLKFEYDAICDAVPDMRKFTHQQFVWARLVVITRIFGQVIKGNKTDGLVPMADMLNHRKPKDESALSSSSATSFSDTKWSYNDELSGFVITAVRAIPRGEQIFDSYGRKCNSRFFVNYGFSLESNEDDNEAVMKFSLAPKDPLYAMKTRLVGGRQSFQNREFQVPSTYRETSDREKKTREMFSFLRYIHAENSELMVIGSTGQDGETRIRIEDIEPISVENEIRVLKHIESAAKEALAAFTCSLDEDNELIAKNDFPDWNIRNCILQRRGEKQVLHWYLKLVSESMKLLNQPWKDVKRITAKCYQSRENIDYYIVSCIVPLVKKA